MNMFYGLRISPEAKLLAQLFEKSLANGTLPKSSVATESKAEKIKAPEEVLQSLPVGPQQVETHKKANSEGVATDKKKVAKTHAVTKEEEQKTGQPTTKKKRTPRPKTEKLAEEKPQSDPLPASDENPKSEAADIESEQSHIEKDLPIVPAFEAEKDQTVGTDSLPFEDPKPEERDARSPEQYYRIAEIKDREGNFIWWIDEGQRISTLMSTKNRKKEFLNLRRDLSKLQHFPIGGYIFWENRIFPCFEKPTGCNGIVISAELKERLQKIEVPGIFTKA